MITYCTNIHKGENWDDLLTSVWPKVHEIKKRVAPDHPFPVGLRLSALAAREATQERADNFLELCTRHGCFIPTINGFPYGSFHEGRVKEQVYLPDWRDRRRVEYTLDLVRLLQAWLPPSIPGSISTVPVGYGRDFDKSDLALVRQNILVVLSELERVATTGKKIVLALEPEPGCYLESARDMVSFVQRMELPPALRPYLGVCFDCCHAAVLFEDPAEAFSALREAEIPVAKIHVSSAARITSDHHQVAKLFNEPHYLHQTTVRTPSGTFRYKDLSEAVAANASARGEWRIHYHLPIFDDGNDIYGTTNGFIREVLAYAPPDSLLEIETYTYYVLPRQVSHVPLSDFICKEIDWLRSCR